jgi:hypothetical protein
VRATAATIRASVTTQSSNSDKNPRPVGNAAVTLARTAPTPEERVRGSTDWDWGLPRELLHKQGETDAEKRDSSSTFRSFAECFASTRP